MRRISIGYPLISGDLPAYDLPCGASHLFGVIAYRRACTLHLHQWLNALRSSSTAAGLNFGVLRWLHTRKCAAHLVKRCAFGQMPRVLPIGQMRCPFGQMRKLIKCGLQQHTWNWKVSNSNIKSWTQNRRQNTHPANNIVSCHRYASYHLHHQFNLYRPTV